MLNLRLSILPFIKKTICGYKNSRDNGRLQNCPYTQVGIKKWVYLLKSLKVKMELRASQVGFGRQ